MEITFQNKRQDLEAFYDYMVKETEEGKTIGRRAFLFASAWIILCSILIGLLAWATTEEWQVGLRATLVVISLGTFYMLIDNGFKPIYNSGLKAYRNTEKSLTSKDLQVFQLPRTIAIDENWLELRSSEIVHRWRWRQIDKIGTTHNFIFIHVGQQTIACVPKRDFQSEQSFIVFDKRLRELMEKYKDEPIGVA